MAADPIVRHETGYGPVAIGHGGPLRPVVRGLPPPGPPLPKPAMPPPLPEAEQVLDVTTSVLAVATEEAKKADALVADQTRSRDEAAVALAQAEAAFVEAPGPSTEKPLHTWRNTLADRELLLAAAQRAADEKRSALRSAREAHERAYQHVIWGKALERCTPEAFHAVVDPLARAWMSKLGELVAIGDQINAAIRKSHIASSKLPPWMNVRPLEPVHGLLAVLDDIAAEGVAIHELEFQYVRYAVATTSDGRTTGIRSSAPGVVIDAILALAQRHRRTDRPDEPTVRMLADARETRDAIAATQLVERRNRENAEAHRKRLEAHEGLMPAAPTTRTTRVVR